jgi:hypothetical protein
MLAHEKLLYELATKVISSVIFVISLSSCWYAVDHYYISDVVVNSEALQIKRNGSLSLRGVRLVVRPANALRTYSTTDEAYPYGYYEDFGYGRRETPDYFIFEILVRSGNADVVITPEKIILNVDNQKINAASYFSLEQRYSDSDMFVGSLRAVSLCKRADAKSWSGEDPLKSSNEILSNRILKLDRNTDYCFAIKFKTHPPNPRTSFSIDVDGININGDDIQIPTIKYMPGTYTFRHA